MGLHLTKLHNFALGFLGDFFVVVVWGLGNFHGDEHNIKAQVENMSVEISHEWI